MTGMQATMPSWTDGRAGAEVVVKIRSERRLARATPEAGLDGELACLDHVGDRLGEVVLERGVGAEHELVLEEARQRRDPRAELRAGERRAGRGEQRDRDEGATDEEVDDDVLRDIEDDPLL